MAGKPFDSTTGKGGGRFTKSKVPKKVRSYEAYRKWDLKRRYGISPEEYNEMFEMQKGCCYICKRHQTEFKNKLHVDHNHHNGELRRLLCGNCNTGLGMFMDSPELLIKAAEYLR